MSDTNQDTGGAFLGGLFVGALVMTILTLVTLQETNRIVSTTKITPETQLTTDGQVVDTLYIYTEK
jgi:hypothetical protein